MFPNLHGASGAFKATTGSTVDPDEITRFTDIAAEWWNPDGPFKPLHKLNPVRVDLICEKLCTHFRRDPAHAHPLTGLRILDIGCGGGLLSLALARLGAEVTGIDASAASVDIAQAWAEKNNLKITFHHSTTEALLQRANCPEQFDAVMSMEIIEHVADPESFSADCAAFVRPGGLFFGSTLNRNGKSWLLAILGAEVLLRWVPRGTHNWHKFLRPAEYVSLVQKNGLMAQGLCGLVYHPVLDRWFRDETDIDVNYMVVALKPSEREP